MWAMRQVTGLYQQQALLLRRVGGQMLAPPHSLQSLLLRWCWQMPAPPHSLHWLLSRWCWQTLAPPSARVWGLSGSHGCQIVITFWQPRLPEYGHCLGAMVARLSSLSGSHDCQSMGSFWQPRLPELLNKSLLPTDHKTQNNQQKPTNLAHLQTCCTENRPKYSRIIPH